MTESFTCASRLQVEIACGLENKGCLDNCYTEMQCMFQISLFLCDYKLSKVVIETYQSVWILELNLVLPKACSRLNNKFCVYVNWQLDVRALKWCTLKAFSFLLPLSADFRAILSSLRLVPYPCNASLQMQNCQRVTLQALRFIVALYLYPPFSNTHYML